jgi:tRNA A37 threonylcarbamoyladenosine dehydratase
MKPVENAEDSCRNHCVCPPDTKRKCTIRRQIPGSISFVPSVAGLILAGEVIKDLIKA